MQKVNSNKSVTHEKILEELRNPRTNEERKRICLMLSHAYEGLHSVGITIYPNIIKSFSINDFKGSEFYVDLILSIVEKITLATNVNFKWLKRRTLQKANIEEKKIVLCYLLFVYPQYFIEYLKDFLLQKKSNEEKVQKLIASLQKTFQDCTNNNNSNNIQLSAKSNVHKINQEQEHQNLQNQNSEHQNLQNQNSEHQKLENQNSENQEQENQNSEEDKLGNKPLTKEENGFFGIGQGHNSVEFLFKNCFGSENDFDNDPYSNGGLKYDNEF